LSFTRRCRHTYYTRSGGGAWFRQYSGQRVRVVCVCVCVRARVTTAHKARRRAFRLHTKGRREIITRPVTDALVRGKRIKAVIISVNRYSVENGFVPFDHCYITRPPRRRRKYVWPVYTRAPVNNVSFAVIITRFIKRISFIRPRLYIYMLRVVFLIGLVLRVYQY